MSSAAPEKEVPQHAPGQELRVAREAAGISLTDLADRTLISPHRLEALERDDYDAVGGAAYVKGYARACARQLHLNPNHVVQAFEDKLASTRPIHPDPGGTGHRRPSAPVEFGDEGGSSPLRTLISGVLALIVLGLFLAVLFGDTGRTSGEIERENLETVTLEAAHDGQSFTTAASDLELPQAEYLPSYPEGNLEAPATEAGQGASISDSEAASPAAPVVESSGQSASGNPLSPEETASGQSFTSGSFSATTAPNTAADGTVASGDASAVAGEAPLRLLELSFSEPCWVEVTDANGERIIAREAQSGDNLRLSGPAPFVVVLGNAPAASVSLDGEPVTMRPRPGTNVVRLNLGTP